MLRPAGGLGVIWNSWDESVPWVARVQSIVHEHAGDAPRQANSAWDQQLRATALFTPVIERRCANVVRGDLDTLLARVASTSYIGALEPAARADVLRRVRDVVAGDPTLHAAGLEMPYRTDLICCRRHRPTKATGSGRETRSSPIREGQRGAA